MHELRDRLLEQNVIYVTRDIERALGLPLNIEGYYIIANSTPFAKTITEGHTNVLLIESPELLDTHELLTHQQAVKYIKARVNPQILVFKNTPTIEKICAERNWKLLNPSATLANRVEEKISQVEWLADLDWFLPPHKILTLKEVQFSGIQFLDAPFIVQFNRAHTGNGTILIDTEEKLDDLKAKFPDRPVRVTKYHDGMMLTSNNIVTNDGVMVGNVSCQITGLAPFTDQPFATIGNDWNLGNGTDIYYECVEQVGNRLREQGWRGLFGLDFLLTNDDKSGIGNLFLIEINARQPASTSYESTLQTSSLRKQESTNNKVTTFEAHLMSLLGLDLNDKELIEVNNGAQIIIRNKIETRFNQSQLQKITQKLTAENFHVIPYVNTAPGSDLLRIQSNVGIMKNYKNFNEVGEKIKNIITE